MKNILINETNIHGNIEAVYSVPLVTLQATYIEWIKNLNKYYAKAGMKKERDFAFPNGFPEFNKENNSDMFNFFRLYLTSTGKEKQEFLK